MVSQVKRSYSCSRCQSTTSGILWNWIFLYFSSFNYQHPKKMYEWKKMAWKTGYMAKARDGKLSACAPCWCHVHSTWGKLLVVGSMTIWVRHLENTGLSQERGSVTSKSELCWVSHMTHQASGISPLKRRVILAKTCPIYFKGLFFKKWFINFLCEGSRRSI